MKIFTLSNRIKPNDTNRIVQGEEMIITRSLESFAEFF